MDEGAELEAQDDSARAPLACRGEPGTGKTRLLAELACRAQRRGPGFRVLMGRSWEAETVRPIGAWSDLFAGLRAALGGLVPALDYDDASALDESHLFRAAVRLLEALCSAQGALVLAFADLQWMDASSGALLSVVTRQRGARLGVVCAGRTGEFADAPAALALLRAWVWQGTSRRIAIGRLAPGDAAALARTVRGEADVQDIVARSGGNPLHVIELARCGAGEDGALAANVAFHVARGGDNVRLAAEAGLVAARRALRPAARDEAFALARRALRRMDRAELAAAEAVVPGRGAVGRPVQPPRAAALCGLAALQLGSAQGPAGPPPVRRRTPTVDSTPRLGAALLASGAAGGERASAVGTARGESGEPPWSPHQRGALDEARRRCRGIETLLADLGGHVGVQAHLERLRAALDEFVPASGRDAGADTTGGRGETPPGGRSR